MKNKNLTAVKAVYAIISVLLCVLGIFLIVVPGISAFLICQIGAIVMMVFGVIKLFSYFAKDQYKPALQHDLAFGILLIALGIITMLRTDMMFTLLCIILGIFVLADSLMKIQVAIDSKRIGIRRWWLILIAAVPAAVIGFMLVLCPFESAWVIMIFFGASLIAEGILSLITILTGTQIHYGLPEEKDDNFDKYMHMSDFL